MTLGSPVLGGRISSPVPKSASAAANPQYRNSLSLQPRTSPALMRRSLAVDKTGGYGQYLADDSFSSEDINGFNLSGSISSSSGQILLYNVLFFFFNIRILEEIERNRQTDREIYMKENEDLSTKV